MLPAGFEPPISADERPKTYALDRAANETGPVLLCPTKISYGLTWGETRTSAVRNRRLTA
jgi:hypothetical protein